MKEHFVVDENTIILAHTRTNDRLAPDDTCLDLIKAIIQNCHAFVWTPEIWGKYSRQVEILNRKRVMIVPGLMRLIKASLLNPEKDTLFLQDDQLTEVEGLDQLPSVDRGDRVFVRCAATVEGSILVTTDRRLIAAIQNASIPGTYKFRATLPEDARKPAG